MSFIEKNALRGDADLGELHIAGLVVHAKADMLESVKQAIRRLSGAEIHAVSEQGKLIVTLEGHRAAELAAQLSVIHALPGVYSAALVYQHHEDIESLNQEVSDEADSPRIH